MAPCIMCGLDGSPTAREALRAAATLAEALERRLVLVTVADPSGDGRYERAREDVLAHGAELLEREAARCGVRGRVELRALAGRPAETLAHLALQEGAAILAVGARGRGGARSRVLGGVARALLAEPPCPVLVVPAGAAWRHPQRPSGPPRAARETR